MLRIPRPHRQARSRLLALAAPALLALAAPSAQAAPYFSPQSVWNTPLAANAPLATNSAALSAKLAATAAHEIQYGPTPTINTTAYSSPVYTVPAGQPTVNVVLDWNTPALNAAIAAVPVPSNAVPASGRDQHMVISQPSSDSMWEFWHMRQALQPVPSVSATVVAGAGSLPAASYLYRVTALTAQGETTAAPTNGVSVTTTAGSKVSVSWRGIIGATGYRVYRGAPGTTGQLVGQVNQATTTYGTTVTFGDTGTSTPGVAPPTVNTAATPGVWHAGWAGRILNASAHPGHYRKLLSSTGNILEDAPWGSTASSLPMAAGLMMISELQSGHIDHALSIALPDTKAKSWVWPAQRTDGGDTSVDAIPEGARFRLNPALDINSLNLPPFTKMMAVAAQKYGIIVNDRTLSSIAVRGEDPSPLIRAGLPNPYTNLYKDATGKTLAPYQLMAKFPWSQLQLVAVPTNPW